MPWWDGVRAMWDAIPGSFFVLRILRAGTEGRRLRREVQSDAGLLQSAS